MIRDILLESISLQGKEKKERTEVMTKVKLDTRWGNSQSLKVIQVLEGPSVDLADSVLLQLPRMKTCNPLLFVFFLEFLSLYKGSVIIPPSMPTFRYDKVGESV